jgi:hypothetical protein
MSNSAGNGLGGKWDKQATYSRAGCKISWKYRQHAHNAGGRPNGSNYARILHKHERKRTARREPDPVDG